MLSKDKGASTTCSQFASMDSETGLLGSPNDDQTTTIKSMLSAHDKATNDSNVRVAYLKIIQYWGCSASQVLKACLDRPSTIANSLDGPVPVLTGVRSMTTVTYLSPRRV